MHVFPSMKTLFFWLNPYLTRILNFASLEAVAPFLQITRFLTDFVTQDRTEQDVTGQIFPRKKIVFWRVAKSLPCVAFFTQHLKFSDFAEILTLRSTYRIVHFSNLVQILTLRGIFKFLLKSLPYAANFSTYSIWPESLPYAASRRSWIFTNLMQILTLRGIS